MRKELESHLTEDELEAYALLRTDEHLSAVVEGHLFLCPFCRMALDRLEEDINLMRLVLN
jgi:hypothetical protein